MRALPTLPLPAGAKVMFFGHSAVQRASFTTGTPTLTGIASVTRGVSHWLRSLDQRFNLDEWADPYHPFQAPSTTNALNGAAQGIGGDHLDYQSAGNPGTLARTPFIIAKQPAVVNLWIGENDIASGGFTDASAIVALLDQQVGLLTAAGIWVVLNTLSPRQSWAGGSLEQTLLDGCNSWVAAQTGRAGVKVCDLRPVLGSSAASQVLALFATDQIHPNDRGAAAVAAVLLPILRSMVADGAYYDTDPRLNNRFPDGGLLGTAGVKTNVTGSVATGFTATRVTGISTCVASKEVISDRFEKQVFTFTPVADANQVHRFQMFHTADLLLAPNGLAPGDWLQWMAYVEFSAWAYWSQLQSRPPTKNGAVTTWDISIFRADATAAGQVLPPAGGAGWWISQPWQIPAGSDRLALSGNGAVFDAYFLGAGTGTGTLKLSQYILRKVIDPRIAWNPPAQIVAVQPYDLAAALAALLPGVVVQRELIEAAAARWAAKGFVALDAADVAGILAAAGYPATLPAYPAGLPRFADSNPASFDDWARFGAAA